MPRAPSGLALPRDRPEDADPSMPLDIHDADPVTSIERAAWRVARAPRAKLLVDAAAYYGTLREVLKRARHRIVMVGWDIDSRTPLAADPTDTGDDLPLELGAFLAELARRRPEIEIRLLLWDYSLLFALEREPLPRLQLGWTSPPQIVLCMDGTIPAGASHHEKLVIVDDAVAFCGGIDVTIRRWDTPAHDPADAGRVDPGGQGYGPFHDVQLMVDGGAAAVLAEAVRVRWAAAAGVELAPVAATADPWPRGLEPDLREVDVAIARTRPELNGGDEVREVEATFRAAIAEAERFIYIENQYLTAGTIAEALLARMRQRPELEVMAVLPGEHTGWLEKNAMQAGRARFVARFHRHGLADRIRLYAPEVDKDGKTVVVTVHAKVMVVDDRSLRIGSANLNNRSMGFDSECDLIVLARDDERRRAVRRLRDGLIAEHTGATVEAVAAVFADGGRVLDALAGIGGDGRRLVPVQDDPELADTASETISTLADPDRPWPEAIALEAFRETTGARRWIRRWPVAAVTLAVVGLALLWRYSPLAEWTRIEHLVEPMRMVAASDWAPLATIGIYLVGGLTLFPITVLIAVTAMVFGPWEGVLYSLLGSVAAALTGYAVGWLAGRRAPPVRRIRNGRVARLIKMFAGNGVVGIASLRMLPLAPFMLINLAAGAARVRFLDFAIGSALGLGPGIVAFNLMGVQLQSVLTQGRAEDIGVLLGLLAAWFGLTMLLQRVINRQAGALRDRTR